MSFPDCDPGISLRQCRQELRADLVDGSVYLQSPITYQRLMGWARRELASQVGWTDDMLMTFNNVINMSHLLTTTVRHDEPIEDRLSVSHIDLVTTAYRLLVQHDNWCVENAYMANDEQSYDSYDDDASDGDEVTDSDEGETDGSWDDNITVRRPRTARVLEYSDDEGDEDGPFKG